VAEAPQPASRTQATPTATPEATLALIAGRVASGSWPAPRLKVPPS
jgi:hypothetical protein